jgi:hypothetical protein
MLGKTPTDVEQCFINYLMRFNLQLQPPPFSISPHKLTIDAVNVPNWISERNSEGCWNVHQMNRGTGKSSSDPFLLLYAELEILAPKTKDHHRILAGQSPLGDITNINPQTNLRILEAYVATTLQCGPVPKYSHYDTIDVHPREHSERSKERPPMLLGRRSR